MSKKGIRGGSASDFSQILTRQQASLIKLTCFISAAEFLVGNPSQADLLFALFDACRETVRELDQYTLDLHAIRRVQERPDIPISQVSKGRALQ